MKKVAVIVSIVIVVLILGAATYLIITMNNTISALSNKVNAQGAQNQTADTLNPEPTENHEVEIAQLEILYNKKEILINGYSEKATEILESYKNDDDFMAQYSIASTDYDSALNIYNQIKDNLKKCSPQIISAVTCAIYKTYSDEKKLTLSDARGNIDLLYNNYDTSYFNKAKRLLNSIDELSI